MSGSDHRSATPPQAVDDLLQSAFRYALSLAHDRELAEDLVQDACVSIMHAGGSWERAYFFTTIRNRFIDRYRRRRKLLFLPLEGDEDAAGSIGEVRGDDDWDMPDVLANGHLEAALAELRPEERETIYLAVVEGYTAQEIAAMTSRPRGTILSLLHRTRAKLRTILNQKSGRAMR